MTRPLAASEPTIGLADAGHAQPVRRESAMRFGTEIRADGVRFRLWAPRLANVALRIDGRSDSLPMAAEDGWHVLDVPGLGAGALYRFGLPDGAAIPDPASRFQPQDVHGPSEVIDPAAYEWQDGDWRGRPWHQAVLYELHVGTFTGEGTFRAAIARLEALAELGVTAIELMPVADFPGGRNWGYDGTFLFAPDSAYGRPEDMKAFVDAAHRLRLMVILDVVYNHFGPDGNYWPACAPIFTDRHRTPWGQAVNFDAEGSDTVRELIVSNARYWIEEYNLDGLRLDAVHAIRDDSPRHILDAIADAVRGAADGRGREVHLVLEDERNTVARLARSADGRPLRYTAQWNDDLHHALHVALTGEDAGYYAAFAGDTEKLGRALAFGFSRPNRGNRPEAEDSSASLPPTAFIPFLQNHDQVGNRALGDRLVDMAARDALRAAVAILLLSPQIPLLFMGEEWRTTRPFPFFCDFNQELSKAVREGRRAEFAHFPAWQDPGARELIPDPTALATFRAAKLDWENAGGGAHAEWRRFHQELLAVRHAEIVPRLAGIRGHGGEWTLLGPGAVEVRWRLGDNSLLTLLANLSAGELPSSPALKGRRLWLEGSLAPGRIGPWTAAFSLADG